MASDSTSSDDECSSNSKSDNKVADSNYANSISEEEETSDSEKYITKKISFQDRSKGKEVGQTNQKPVRRQKQKRTKLQYDQDKSGSAESPKPRSRLNITYFSNLIEGLSNEQRSIIENSSFGSLLNFQRCAIPLSFVKWIASHTDVSCSDIVVNGRSIPINPNTTNFILGIPNGGLEIKHDNDAGKHFFHQHYGSTKPLISFFGTKLLSDKGVNKLSEDDVLRCFMVIIYLDFKDFGIRNILIGPPPRISVWKGGMIKEYSKMDECKTGDFGKRPIKAMEKLSYDAICSGARCIQQQGNNSNMSRSDALQQYHSKSFNPRLIDDISTVCKWFTREYSDTTYGKNAQLAAKRLKATQPISTQPDKEESNKDDLFVEPIYTIPAKKEEVQPTKDLESNSTEFVIDIEGSHNRSHNEFLYEEEPSDNINMVEQRAQPQINNEQSSPQTPLHINITSARTPATKQVIQISSQPSPDIGNNSPRIAQMREPNQHAQTEERQYSMTRIIDSLNASGNCCGTRHNLYRPKRIVHLSKYKSSPYDNYTRHQTFSAAELNHYNNILSIGETQHKFAVLMDNVKVTWSSLSKSLSPRGVVDTYVLNAYAKKIANDQNNKENEYRNFYFFHRISVYFLKNWEGVGKEEDYENCARQTFTFARNKKPLHYYDLLIFPCLYDNHWFVFTVDIKGHHFVFLDSIYDENSKYDKKIQGLLIPGLIAMWEEFLDVEKDFSKFDIQHPPITRQNNG
uniref:Ubiquitin-like protease family profile domain-containing protein n=1 Tax=Oryza sativa subsp. japonica TaxID=39947 RepID=Q60DT0_ORYSJ|nr:hypothetical protein [Oryza sativa Japonica Group]